MARLPIRSIRLTGLVAGLLASLLVATVACGGTRTPNAIESVDGTVAATITDASDPSVATPVDADVVDSGGGVASTTSFADSVAPTSPTGANPTLPGSPPSESTVAPTNGPAQPTAPPTTPTAPAATATPSIPDSTTAPVPPPAPPPTVEPPPPANPSLLAGLRIEPEYASGYDRDLFRHWIDADGDGCDTRREVLIVEAVTTPQVGSGCSLTNGSWYSVYDGITTTDPSTFDIDHVIALKEAWDSGAWNWTPEQRRSFANDLSSPLSLVAVSASSNRSKSDRDPAEWLPPLAAYRCTYADTWVRVKLAWNLSVDQAEYDALSGILAGC